MKCNLNILSACLLLWTTSWAPAQEGSGAGVSDAPLTLDEAINLALSNSPVLRASRGEVLAASGRASQLRQWSNPDLELATEDWSVGEGGFRESKRTIGVSQTLPWPGKKRLDARIGDAGVEETQAAFKLRKLELVRDVKAAFYSVLAHERMVKVTSGMTELAQSMAQTTGKRVEAGAAPDQEQLRAEIQLEQSRALLVVRKRDLALARRDLATLIGKPERYDAPLNGTLSDGVSVPAQMRSLDWIQRHPSMQLARAVISRAQLENRRAGLEPYPDVRLGVDGGYDGFEDNSIVQLRLSVPLPILDRSKGAREHSRGKLAVAEADLDKVEQDLRKEYASASQRLEASKEEVAAYRDRILPKAERALTLVQTGFDEGKFGLMDLLDTQRTSAETQLTFQEKLLELNIALAELEALAANLPEEISIPSTQDHNE